MLVVLLAFAGWAGFAPSSVHASCGDYVAYRSMHSEHVAGSLPQHQPLKGDSPLRAPCHGPHCQRGSQQPAPLAPLVTPPPSVEWGCVAPAAVMLLPDLLGFLAEPDLPATTSLLSPIYHPPR